MSAGDRLTSLKCCQRPSLIPVIVEGSNIDVNNTNPYKPVVSVFVDEPLDMHGQNLTDSTGTLHLTSGSSVDITAQNGLVINSQTQTSTTTLDGFTILTTDTTSPLLRRLIPPPLLI